jgi:signal transduction histidine kinase
LAYQELRNFNELLQQKVNEQTKELQAKVILLQEARRKERDMIDIMGHELRTPATIAKLNVELLHNLTDEIINNKDKFKLYVSRIQNAVENEIKLINTLLSSAKLEGNRIEINPEEVNVLDEIEMTMHGHEIDAQEKNLKLLNQARPETPTIYADHARVIEVLNNLVDNAIKYTKKGSITIGTEYDDNSVTVSITDTGEGIREEDLQKLGQKFYRIDNYLDDKEGRPDIIRPGGTGLGLYVAFGLIEKMGGNMQVKSVIDQGSSFSFTLPRYQGQVLMDKTRQSNNMFERLGLKR